MSANTGESLVRRFFEEGFNGRNLDLIDELIASEYVNHNMPAPAPGPDGFKRVITGFISAFPDMRITIEDVVSEGDRVATRGTWTGTHDGEFNGIPATGRSVAISYCDIWRIENGRFVENWVQMDMVGLMGQLGVLPE